MQRAGHELGRVPGIHRLDPQRAAHEDVARRRRVAAEVHQPAEQVLGIGAQQRIGHLGQCRRQELLGVRRATGEPEGVRRGDHALDAPRGRGGQLGGPLERPRRDAVAAARTGPLGHRCELAGDLLVAPRDAGGPMPRAPVGLPLPVRHAASARWAVRRSGGAADW